MKSICFKHGTFMHVLSGHPVDTLSENYTFIIFVQTKGVNVA